MNTADREVVTTRVVNAPPARVFEAWIDPKHVVQWWGPDGFTTTIEEMDVQPGGVWRSVMRGPDGTDYRNKSVFDEIAWPARLVYSHITGPVFRMTVTFDEGGGKTTAPCACFSKRRRNARRPSRCSGSSRAGSRPWRASRST